MQYKNWQILILTFFYYLLLVLGETAARSEVTAHVKSRGQGQAKSLTQQAAPPNIVITKPEHLLHHQISGSASQAQSQGHISSPQVMTTVSMVTKTVTVATSASGGSVSVASSTQPGSNPLMARLVQQMSGGQMLSVSDLLAAQRIQGAQPRTTTAFKIQGRIILHVVFLCFFLCVFFF